MTDTDKGVSLYISRAGEGISLYMSRADLKAHHSRAIEALKDKCQRLSEELGSATHIAQLAALTRVRRDARLFREIDHAVNAHNHRYGSWE